ncbi:lipid A export permease/ATP-binding protein MsbA [mine drainage metagenome]|uniref:Lipid A export permease/ATP-binding protein MsbA n=2 Tax=mine drainage metagenome TaxID=410659 RepID=T1BK64_9ZZZZ
MKIAFFNLDQNARSTYFRLLRYIRPYWGMFAASAFAMLVYALSQPAFAALIRPLLNGSFEHERVPYLDWIPLIIVGIFLIRGLAGFWATYGMAWVGRRVIQKIRSEMFARLAQWPAERYDQLPGGMLVSALTYNIEQVAEGITYALTVLIRDSLTVVGLLGWMLYLAPGLCLFLVVVAPLILLLVRNLSRRFRRVSSRIQETMGEVTRIAEEAVAGQAVIKSYNGAEWIRRRFEQVNTHNRDWNLKLALNMAASGPLIQFVAGFGIALVVYAALLAPVLHVVSVGTFISFLSALLLLLAPLKHLTNVNAPIQKGVAAVMPVFEILDSPGEDLQSGRPLELAKGAIEMEQVTFSYGPSQPPVLEGISFRIHPGEMIAVVGRSGSGKTTLTELLVRLYEVNSGVIRLDGRDIREWRLADLRRQITLVSQDGILFYGSLADNMCYGCTSPVSPSELEEAAAEASLLDEIRKMPEGFQTSVGERGLLLSGGQRQRVMIARALLRRAPILILDEATSALDAVAEQNVEKAIRKASEGRTTLVIAHRLSTIERADRILVLDSGRIVDEGTHAQLLKRLGLYTLLHQSQAENRRILEDARS